MLSVVGLSFYERLLNGNLRPKEDLVEKSGLEMCRMCLPKRQHPEARKSFQAMRPIFNLASVDDAYENYLNNV